MDIRPGVFGITEEELEEENVEQSNLNEENIK